MKLKKVTELAVTLRLLPQGVVVIKRIAPRPYLNAAIRLLRLHRTGTLRLDGKEHNIASYYDGLCKYLRIDYPNRPIHFGLEDVLIFELVEYEAKQWSGGPNDTDTTRRRFHLTDEAEAGWKSLRVSSLDNAWEPRE